MKAIVYQQYGPPEVLHMADVPKPVPADNEVLVKICATTVTAGDVRMRSFTVPWAEWLPARLYLGITKPKRSVLGMELSGEVEAIGKNVTRFQPGDQVFAFAGLEFGAYAQYKCLPEEGSQKGGMVEIKPVNITHQQAAAIPCGGMTALRFLRKAQIKRGQTVLIYGASGSVGTFAVQLAKHDGAEVTGVCSRANLEWVKALGADKVMDYTAQDMTKSGLTFDIVFDAVGKLKRSQCKNMLKEKGLFLSAHDSGSVKPDGLVYLKELVEAGAVRPVIDRCYPLDQMAEAHRYVQTGHKKGNVVVAVP